MWRFFGFSSTAEAKPEPSRGLLASWYRSHELHQLERRAIISRKWILVTHSLRFKQAGDYVSFVYAELPFFLMQDREGNINGFHNVCRHREYPVVETRSGKASILSCKYHGWSYGFKGNLAKAPRFDTVKGFDKNQHGLLPIHVRIDPAGFIWVNLQAGEPDVKWEDDFGGVYEKPRMQNFDFAGGYKYDHVWEMELEASWKAVIENYNECYHCPTSHQLIAGVSDIPKYKVEPSGGCLEHEIINKMQEEKDQFRRSITFFFPCTSVTITQNFFYIQRMIPVGATRTRIENEVYRHHNSTDEEFAAINTFYKQALKEDKQLCIGAQENLSAGVFINGELHPDKKKKGPIHFQNTVRKEVMEHRKKELSQGGREIWPAAPKLFGEMNTCKLSEEETFCSELEKASCGSRQELAW